MTIPEMQDDKFIGHTQQFNESIAFFTSQWNDKTISDVEYHSELSFYYSLLYMPEQCKIHAAQIPGGDQSKEKQLSLLAVARMLVFEKKIEEALSYYKQTDAMDAEQDSVLEEAGWCCFDLQKWKEAEAWFTKGSLLFPEKNIFWEGIGRSLAQQERYTEALLAFEKALAVSDKVKFFLYQHLIGQCYACLNDFYRALDHYTKCLDARPTYATALNDMAALYYNQEGDVDNAISYLKNAEAIAEKEQNSHTLQMVYLNLAQLYKKLKEFDLQEHYHQKFMEIIGFGYSILDEGEEDEDDGDVN